MASAKHNSSPTLAGYLKDESKAAMLRFQDSLPRLPVPTLEETAKRYLKSIHPLLSSSEYIASEAAVRDFIKPGGIGHKLQARLIAKRDDPATKNWVYEWWQETTYAENRAAVVPYVSVFCSHRNDSPRSDPAKRAAAITSAALDFKRLIDTSSLEPEFMNQLPLCMDTYRWMFNVTRIPSRPADFPKKFSEGKHIVAIRKNQYFKISHEINGNQLNASELEVQFNRVYELAERAPAVGALTSANRDDWADSRELLLQISSNKESLLVIDSATFIVCLDEASPVTLEKKARQYWHGDGANRWYDKPLQFIINDNGTSGFMGEHFMMDGMAHSRLNHYVVDRISNKTSDHPIRSDLPGPQLIQFKLTPALQTEIGRSIANFHDVIGQHQLIVQVCKDYGKNFIKEFKHPPDAYVQMLIQLAYFKMHGKCRPTYESATTRRFQLGRTEACRTVSDESVAWCIAMMDPSQGNATRMELFRKAIHAQIEYVAAAVDGRGVDRHLFGLKKLLQPDEEIPAIYKDPAFGYSSSWYLYTSQVSSEFYDGMGYSQAIDQGFGVAYMINENSLSFNVVSKNLGSDRMGVCLNEAAGQMRDLMLSIGGSPRAEL
ncbi:acyltransferase ChoActase/COT/CPT [Nemania serpens]|nr:acyltransferase ChoActase/COT/CPT [Nemania serpens]